MHYFFNRLNVRNSLLIVVGLWVFYATLSVLAPAGQALARYGITLTQGNLLRATVLLPQLLMWLAAVFAVARFYHYAAFTRGSSEGTGFRQISHGLGILLLGLIIPSYIFLIASYYPDSQIVQKVIVILRNYVQVVFYFGAFWYLWQGSCNLNKTIELVHKPGKRTRALLNALIISLVSLFVWFIFQNEFRTVSADPLVKPTYYLPDWLIVLTVLLPYIAVWTFGSLAIIEMWTFVKNVPGTIYRQAFSLVMQGVIVTIIMLIGLQFLSQIAQVFAHRSLKFILLVIYILLILITIGYIWIARGARKLATIEEA